MTVISTPFVPVARSLAEVSGIPELPIAEIAHPVASRTDEEWSEKVDRIVDAVLHAISQPPTSTMPRYPGSANGTVDVETDFAGAIEYMIEAKWTDGLPCVPPTKELVAAMLRGTRKPADFIVGNVPPRMGVADLRTLAVNAVMAGCRPEYFPVLIAVVEAVLEESYGLAHRQITTHPGAPLVIVNGPVVEKIGLNAATGVFGPGWRANATIGRALRLILLNLGGAQPGVFDMAQHGHPGKYTYCIAENEAMSPWEPLHVERGFERDQSVVTVVNAEAPHNITEQVQTSARGILTTCASTLTTLGGNNVYCQGEPILALGPEHAARIAKEGWSKQDVKQYLFEVARLPLRMIRDRGLSHGPSFPKWLNDEASEDETAPIVADHNDLIVIVCGGAGGKSMAIPTAGIQSRSVSRLIEAV